MSKTPKEIAKELGVPLIPPMPPSMPQVDPNPTVAVCGACGLCLKRVMGYVCTRNNCPTGLGGTSQ